jgi:hypothetical protein
MTAPATRCFSRALVVATAVCCAAACSTPHILHLGDPGTARQLHEMVLSPGTVAEISPPISPVNSPLRGAPDRALKYDVVAPAPGGLLVTDGSDVPTFAPYDQLQRVQTIDRARGARDGALVVGAAGLLLGGALGVTLARQAQAEPGGGGSPSVPATAIGLGAVFAVVGALVGASYGAVAGHRDIYLVRP